jgi:hypothetical protein
MSRESHRLFIERLLYLDDDSKIRAWLLNNHSIKVSPELIAKIRADRKRMDGKRPYVRNVCNVGLR